MTTVYSDPRKFDGRLLCMRCGRDEQGDYWPLCADRKYPFGPSFERFTHEETCEVYGEHMWMCDECDRAMNEELQASG